VGINPSPFISVNISDCDGIAGTPHIVTLCRAELTVGQPEAILAVSVVRLAAPGTLPAAADRLSGF
jgi:hypothetical protein